MNFSNRLKLLTFDICIETSWKIFPFETIVKDSYPHLGKNLFAEPATEFLSSTNFILLKYDINVSDKPHSYIYTIVFIMNMNRTNLISCKNDMRP